MVCCLFFKLLLRWASVQGEMLPDVTLQLLKSFPSDAEELLCSSVLLDEEVPR